jgi:hypothetical protein
LTQRPPTASDDDPDPQHHNGHPSEPQARLRRSGDRHQITWLVAIVLVASTILGVVLRLHQLEAPSVFIDELYTVRDTIPPGNPAISKSMAYWPTRVALLLTGADYEGLSIDAEHRRIQGADHWRTVTYDLFRAHGIYEWNMRIASAIIGMLCVPILGWLTCKAVGRHFGAVAALFLAIAPWHILWSQHARFYVQQFLFVNMALLLYLIATRKRSWPLMATAMACALLAMLVHPLSLMLFGVIAVDLLASWKLRDLPRPDWKLLLTIGLGVAACLGIGISDYLIRQVQSDASFLAVALSPPRLLLENVYYAGIVLCGVAVVGGPLLWNRNRRLGLFFIAGVVVPLLALAFLISFGGARVFVRYAFFNLFSIIVLASVASVYCYNALRPRLGMLAAQLPIILVVGATALQLMIYFNGSYGDRARWRTAFEWVAERRNPDERVLVELAGPVGMYYMQDPSVNWVQPEDHRTLVRSTDPTWIVTETTNIEARGAYPHWLDDKARLVLVLPTRTALPQTTVRVYYYNPTGAYPKRIHNEPDELSAGEVTGTDLGPVPAALPEMPDAADEAQIVSDGVLGQQAHVQ